jgi:hypothetical protein
MQLQTKALYNLIKFLAFHNPSLKTKKWQIEDLRRAKDKILFNKLSKFGLNLNKTNFLKYSNEIETPEELLEILAAEKKHEEKDQIYLILFELYRRFLSKGRCLSIFCDELDHRIFLYDTNQLDNDELLQNSLANLKSILDANVDLGLSHKEVFQNLLKYLAHDLENFLIDYISEQIDAKNDSYAFDLLDSFYHYVSKKEWFYFLKAKLKSFVDVSISNQIIESLLEKLKQKPDLKLQFRMLRFMVDNGDRNLFIKIVKQTTQFLKKEKEFKQILKIVADYYLRLDNEIMEKKISGFIFSRSKIKNNQNLKKQDILRFLNLLKI